MASLTPAAASGSPPALNEDGAADESAGLNGISQAMPRHAAVPWMRWQLRLLVLMALLGPLSLFGLVRILAHSPVIPGQWQPVAPMGIELVGATAPELQPFIGHRLQRAAGAPGQTLDARQTQLLQSPRWQLTDRERQAWARDQAQLSLLLLGPQVTLAFDDGRQLNLAAKARGVAAMGLVFWLTSALALLLYLLGSVVLLVRPRLRSLLYFGMTLSQACNLLFIAVESLPGLGMPPGLMTHEALARTAFDLFTAAAVVHVVTLRPLKVPARRWFVACAWVAALATWALVANHQLAAAWAWTQGCALTLGLLAIGVLSWAYLREPNPFALLMRRFCIITVATLGLLMMAVVAANQVQAQASVVPTGAMIWTVFLASILLLLPFMARSQQVLREFALLAGVSTVATSLDLLFVAAFSLGQFASLSLAVFLSLGVYAAVRQWLLNQMMGRQRLSAERLFERLFRIVRDVDVNAAHRTDNLARLLRDLFDPLEILAVGQRVARAQVVAGGSALLVPLPTDGTATSTHDMPSLLLRFADRGKRMFTPDDARLSEQVVQQLLRAVAYEKAVERGRAEERLRIAQDLHDDIGARLLTLMYKAPTPEMEDYVRHTLKDLKTLTRGLAATDHLLSHAVGEWKADIAQRLAAAQVDLRWQFEFDTDLTLTMVQWSALTRILRELVSNAIAHARANQISIQGSLRAGRLELQVADNGGGRDPGAWSHGLGLGGVRKRVKLLGGTVAWRENPGPGVVCELVFSDFNARQANA